MCFWNWCAGWFSGGFVNLVGLGFCEFGGFGFGLGLGWVGFCLGGFG